MNEVIFNPFLQGFIWIIVGLLLLWSDSGSDETGTVTDNIGFICLLGGCAIFLAGIYLH